MVSYDLVLRQMKVRIITFLAIAIQIEIQRLRFGEFLQQVQCLIRLALEENRILPRHTIIIVQHYQHVFLIQLSCLTVFILAVVLGPRRIPWRKDQLIGLKNYHVHLLQVLLKLLE